MYVYACGGSNSAKTTLSTALGSAVLVIALLGTRSLSRLLAVTGRLSFHVTSMFPTARQGKLDDISTYRLLFPSGYHHQNTEEPKTPMYPNAPGLNIIKAIWMES